MTGVHTRFKAGQGVKAKGGGGCQLGFGQGGKFGPSSDKLFHLNSELQEGRGGDEVDQGDEGLMKVNPYR